MTLFRHNEENESDAEQFSIKESQWYRNSLSAEPVKIDPNLSNVDKINKLENKAMRRLIDVISPTSPQNQQAFQKMIKKDATVSVILKVAVQMDASVDVTKNIVLNNCL